MNLIGRLKGAGTLVRDELEWKGVRYDIEVWRAESGLKSARGTLSVTAEPGPCELILEGGDRIDLFVTTAGGRGSTVLVKGPIPQFDP
jgi:hypothetical protein